MHAESTCSVIEYLSLVAGEMKAKKTAKPAGMKATAERCCDNKGEHSKHYHFINANHLAVVRRVLS